MQLLPGYTSVRPGYAGSVRLPQAKRRASRVEISSCEDEDEGPPLKKPKSADPSDFAAAEE